MISNTLARFRNLSDGILIDIHQAIKEIKYYEFFEKNIEEIISQLNDLNDTINLNITRKYDEKTAKINKFKKIYTTSSEHEIHELYVKNGMDKSKDYHDKANNEDENLELF